MLVPFTLIAVGFQKEGQARTKHSLFLDGIGGDLHTVSDGHEEDLFPRGQEILQHRLLKHYAVTATMTIYVFMTTTLTTDYKPVDDSITQTMTSQAE